MRMSGPYRWSLVAFLTCMVAPAGLAAQRPIPIDFYPHRIFPICLEQVVVIEVPRFPIGCELVDCCPGCPGPGPIDWRVRVEGPIQQVALRFENAAVTQRSVAIEGRARWSEDGIVLGAGTSMIRGLPAAEKGRVPMATAVVRLDADAMPRDTGAAALDRPGPGTRGRVIVEQLQGDIVVAERVFIYWIRRCPRFPIEPRADRIDLDNNASMDQAVVFLDARRVGGCIDDESHRGSDLIGVGSVLSNGACRSEAAIFSDDDAVRLIENVTVWTDPLGDLLPADQTPDRWRDPVDVWIVRAGLQARSQNEMAQADLLLNTSHAGIDVLTNANYRAVPTAADTATINATLGAVWTTLSCAGVGAVTGDPNIFTAGRINVYFVDRVFTGFWCPGTNIIAVGTSAQPETLAHEFGHAYTLRHTQNVDYDGDGTVDFPATNIMIGGGVGRTEFTEGQCFRMSLNPGSMLNANGTRTAGPTRACTDPTISGACPWVALDATPN